MLTEAGRKFLEERLAKGDMRLTDHFPTMSTDSETISYHRTDPAMDWSHPLSNPIRDLQWSMRLIERSLTAEQFNRIRRLEEKRRYPRVTFPSEGELAPEAWAQRPAPEGWRGSRDRRSNRRRHRGLDRLLFGGPYDASPAQIQLVRTCHRPEGHGGKHSSKENRDEWEQYTAHSDYCGVRFLGAWLTEPEVKGANPRPVPDEG
jgi:hypothetical protein